MNEHEFYTMSLAGIVDYLAQTLKLDPRPPIQNYRFQPTINGRRYLTLRLLINPTPARAVMSMGEPLSMAAGLDGNVSLRIVRGKQGTLLLEIPKPRELWKPLLMRDLPHWSRKGVMAILGADSENRAIGIDFKKNTTPHTLIAGATGSGKSNAGRLVVFDLVTQNQPDEVQLLLIDPKKFGADFGDFNQVPHLVHPLITDDEEALLALTWCVAEMDRRAKQRRNTPRLFIVIDEAQELLVRPEFSALIADLTAVGRSFNIHVALIIQNPTAANIGDVRIKRNVLTRLVGSVDSAESARAAAGVGGSGAEKTLTSAGDMLLIQPGETKRLITALLSESDLQSMPRLSNGTMPQLPLDEVEDPDHVREVVAVQQPSGRTADPLEPEHVYAALVQPDLSLNELRKRFTIGRLKQHAVKEFAQALLKLMESDGYYLCRTGGPERNGNTAQGLLEA